MGRHIYVQSLSLFSMMLISRLQTLYGQKSVFSLHYTHRDFEKYPQTQGHQVFKKVSNELYVNIAAIVD